MKHLKFLLILSLSILILACNQEPGKNNSAPKNSYDKTEKTPLEELVTKVENTVLLEPLRSLEDNQYFYNMKQTLTRALENSTQKEMFFSCTDFKKTLQKILQTDYSTDFMAGSWQRTEVENLAQTLAKEQCAEIQNLRVNFLADLQSSVSLAEDKDVFLKSTKPFVENYAKEVLKISEKYTNIFNKVLEPYKKLRQVFYPLEQAGYGTYLLEQNDFKALKKIVLPYMKSKSKIIDETKINNLLNKAQEEEKVLFVFLKKYENLTRENGECISKFFKGLQNKWYDFMYEIEKLPAAERQAYADKRFNQAKTGLDNKCPTLYKEAKQKQKAQAQQREEDFYQPEPESEPEQNEEEIYDF